jgi:CHAT domain-containing protein
MRRDLGIALLALIAVASAPGGPALGADSGEFALGPNAEKQPCRAVERLEGAKGDIGVDIYCGAWERPSGRLTASPAASRERALAILAADCHGQETVLASTDFEELRQIACQTSGGEEASARRYGVIATRRGKVMTGTAYPSDWAALIHAAKVLGGAAARTAPVAVGASTPGMQQIEALYPSGPPGQGAEFNYELLRRRAYEHNTMGNYAAAERDFEDLLQAQDALTPDDMERRAELLSEIGLNLSNGRRFAEATEALDRAEKEAAGARASLLLTKITNYRAMDQLNRKRYAAALELALAANAARENARGGVGSSISSTDARKVDKPTSGSRRSLLFQLEGVTPEERRAVLTAQGYYIAGVAARMLGKPETQHYLDEASSALANALGPPGWLQAAIAKEKAELKLSARDYRGAAAAASTGLSLVRATAPQTRSEAHLLLTLVRADAGLGRFNEALAEGRAAVSIFSHQLEQPGMPVDIARGQLELLASQWEKTSDPALAAEYFQTLAMVWDGSAARSAAQLAARLSLGDSGNRARAYQDAERTYRAALARRQRLTTAGGDAPAAAIVAAADKAVQEATSKFNQAEAALRQAAPTYLELLNPTISTADLQGVLQPKEGYLRMIVGSDGGYAALVTREGVWPYRIALSGAQLDVLVARFRKTTTLRGRRLPDFDVDAAVKLYAALLGPVAQHLESLDRMQVDVSGALASVPFAALVQEAPTAEAAAKIKDGQDYTGVNWMGRRFALANSLGPASFVRVRKTVTSAPASAGRLAAFGDFKPDPAVAANRIVRAHGLRAGCEGEIQKALTTLAALPDTASEVKGVAGVFGANSSVRLGEHFTDSTFLESQDVADADVILLATHGVLGLSSCFSEPALLTSLSDSGDGLLEASKVLDRRLKARLVILSACDTAGGGALDAGDAGLAEGGEALSGLARSFLYAGASGVLATEWKVDSASAASEVQDFLRQATTSGAPLSQSLRAAQKTLYDQAETAHPFYWAAFILVGDGSVSIAPASAAPGVLKTAQLTP